MFAFCFPCVCMGVYMHVYDSDVDGILYFFNDSRQGVFCVAVHAACGYLQGNLPDLNNVKIFLRGVVSQKSLNQRNSICLL